MQDVGAFLVAPRLLSPCGPRAPEHEGSLVVEDGQSQTLCEVFSPAPKTVPNTPLIFNKDVLSK